MARVHFQVEGAKKPVCGVLLAQHFSSVWERVTCGLCLRRKALGLCS